MSIAVKTFGSYGLALAALVFVVFGAYDSYPLRSAICNSKRSHKVGCPGLKMVDLSERENEV